MQHNYTFSIFENLFNWSIQSKISRVTSAETYVSHLCFHSVQQSQAEAVMKAVTNHHAVWTMNISVKCF